MAISFDPLDKRSWYFGRISRQEATDLLMNEKDGGVFLVRDSSSIPGDFVLCVKEDSKVCHYIINKEDDCDGTKFKIGDRFFPDLSSLLAFYKLHYLDTTPLIRPATRKLEQVIANYDFDGNDPEDLPFKKGEILTIIRKDEEQWWSAKNGVGKIGAIPVPYIRRLEEGIQSSEHHSSSSTSTSEVDSKSNNSGESHSATENNHTSLPTHHKKIEWNKVQYARVKQARVPNAYDDTALKLQVGDIIRVTKTNISGQWEGEILLEGGKIGRKGHFPFNFVEFPINYDPTSVTNEDSFSRRKDDSTHNNRTLESIQIPD